MKVPFTAVATRARTCRSSLALQDKTLALIVPPPQAFDPYGSSSEGLCPNVASTSRIPPGVVSPSAKNPQDCNEGTTGVSASPRGPCQGREHKKGKHSLSNLILVQDSGMPQGEPNMDPMCDEDIMHHDITMVENKNANKGRRQYMTHSRVGKSLTADTTTIFTGRGSGFKFGVASKIVERPEDSDPPTPSL
ncbi:hypothetical protein Peur_002438 [Populus x canadensis]